eukprot:g73564.t1
MSGILGSIKALDAYPKLQEDFKVKTLSGAAVSLTAVGFIIYLFISELTYWLQVDTVDHLYVDTSRGERLPIHFNVTFPHIPCPLISVDAMDVTGAHQLDVNHDIYKISLDPNGVPYGDAAPELLGQTLKEDEVTNDKVSLSDKQKAIMEKMADPKYCGSCYGAETETLKCCNTCEDVKAAYRDKGWTVATLDTVEQCFRTSRSTAEHAKMLQRGDGCNLAGTLDVRKVAGNFHFAPGKSFQHAHMHVHDLAAIEEGAFNVSHSIQSLSFGKPFPGIVNPLDGLTKAVPKGVTSAMFMYYAKVVPTTYQELGGEPRHTNQFSVTEHFRALSAASATGGSNGLPGVFIFYELSPMKVIFTQTREPLSHFLTQLCAILGGVFTVAGMIDRFLYVTVRSMQRKAGIGKLG